MEKLQNNFIQIHLASSCIYNAILRATGNSIWQLDENKTANIDEEGLCYGMFITGRYKQICR